MTERRLVVADTVTTLVPAEAGGAVVLAASHAGSYAVAVALRRGVAALVLHDAGIGRDGAGVAGLELAGRHGVPCAAIDFRSAPIGIGADCLAEGRLSRVNGPAEALGLSPGMSAAEACARLRSAVLPAATPSDGAPDEARRPLAHAGARPVWLLDSASLVAPSDRDAVVVTGSHGGLVGGRPEGAIKAPVFAALFNDAGIGAGRAGLSRLPALDARGIAAATVAADSARIGEAASTYHDGIVSFVNRACERLGGRPSMAASALVDRLADIERTPT